jgi:hypothetical protein
LEQKKPKGINRIAKNQLWSTIPEGREQLMATAIKFINR